MNQGRPPFGDPNAWGNQTQGQPMQQYPQQPYGTGMQTPYQPQQPQQTWQGQQYQQQPYQQQAAYPQQTYQQQTWQPYQQNTGYQQNPYGQQTQSMQAQYPQFNQQGQQVYPVQGYSGYVSQPRQQKSGVPTDVIFKVLLFGAVPLLFVLALGLDLAGLSFSWVFGVLALTGIVGAIVLMWLIDVVSPNVRLTLSLVYAVMAVVTLVGLFSGGSTPSPQNTNQVQTDYQHQQNDDHGIGGFVNTATDMPSVEPVITPSPDVVSGAAIEQLNSFFYFWSVNNNEQMLELTPPSWREAQEKPEQALFQILTNRFPTEYEITSISGTDNDTTRTAQVKATIDKRNNRTPERYSFKIILTKEDGVWYVDPRTLKSNEKETPTPATVNKTPTQPPLYTGRPDTPLYFNPNGGEYYHLDPNCSEVGKKYRPLEGVFYFSELSDPTSPYAALINCNVCGAPIVE